MKKFINPVRSLLVTAILVSGAVSAEENDSHNAAESFKRFDEADEQFSFLNDYCIKCHNFEDWAGSLAFDLLEPNQVAQNIDVWEHTIRKLRGSLMPPAGESRPDTKSTYEFIGWMESYLDHAATLENHAGNVGLHRLNRKEYANAIRDLLNIEVDASALLPQDSSVEGFDNVAEALRVSPSFLDQSLSAARVVAQQAVGNPNARAGGTTYNATGLGSQNAHRNGLPLGTRGGFAVEHYFPSDGDYVLNLPNLAAALWVTNQEFTHTLIATLDGEKIFELEVGGGEDLKAIDQNGDPAVDALNARLKNIPFTTEAGPRTIAVTFIHRSFAEYEGVLHSLQPETGGGQNVIPLNSFEIQGPFNPTGVSATPARNQIFTCYPNNADEELGCANQIINEVARKAYRGPVDSEEVNKLMGVYNTNTHLGFDMAVRRALTAILASPRFLYRVEQVPEGLEPGDVFEISDLDLAARLSFFLWSSIPDEELLNLAEAGDLKRPRVLRNQIRRMLSDEKAETLISNFSFQWLNLGGLEEIVPDPQIFSGIDFNIRELFIEELQLFVSSIFMDDKSVVELMTADYTFMNERLAQHYGYNNVRGDLFRRVELEDSRRYGLLGKGGVLMVSAYPDRTSPVLRGAYILEHITGTPPANPPPNVEALIENQPGQPQMTVRERLEEHRQNPSCNSCHGLMDALGFALENFDAVGRDRDFDYRVGSPIDTSGVLPDGRPIRNTNDLREAILERPDQFVQNLTEKLMLYALGREIEPADMPTVRSIVRQAEREDYYFSEIIMGIVSSDQFLKKQVPHEESAHLALTTTD